MPEKTSFGNDEELGPLAGSFAFPCLQKVIYGPGSVSNVAGEFDALLAAGGETHGIPLPLQQGFEDLAHDFFVVNYENRAIFLHDAHLVPRHARPRSRDR